MSSASPHSEVEPVVTGPVDEALQLLASVIDSPLDERPDAFEAIHRHLRSALAEIDDA